MPMCEKCWADAFDPGGHESQGERYRQLLAERKDRPCTPKQAAGQWWDEQLQIDTRTILRKPAQPEAE